jgi:hypothetical protein
MIHDQIRADQLASSLDGGYRNATAICFWSDLLSLRVAGQFFRLRRLTVADGAGAVAVILDGVVLGSDDGGDRLEKYGDGENVFEVSVGSVTRSRIQLYL